MKDIKNYVQNKGKCKDKSISQKNHIFSCIIMLLKQPTLTFMLIYCQ